MFQWHSQGILGAWVQVLSPKYYCDTSFTKILIYFALSEVKFPTTIRKIVAIISYLGQLRNDNQIHFQIPYPYVNPLDAYGYYGVSFLALSVSTNVAHNMKTMVPEYAHLVHVAVTGGISPTARPQATRNLKTLVKKLGYNKSKVSRMCRAESTLSRCKN